MLIKVKKKGETGTRKINKHREKKNTKGRFTEGDFQLDVQRKKTKSTEARMKEGRKERESKEGVCR